MTRGDHCPTSIRLRKPTQGSWSALLGLVGVLGVLTFIFSAVSPLDDDFQQEFAQRDKAGQCVVRNFRAIPSVHFDRSTCLHYAAILRSLPVVDRSLVGYVLT